MHNARNCVPKSYHIIDYYRFAHLSAELSGLAALDRELCRNIHAPRKRLCKDGRPLLTTIILSEVVVFYCKLTDVLFPRLPHPISSSIYYMIVSTVPLARLAQLDSEWKWRHPRSNVPLGSFRYSTHGRRTDCQTGSIVLYCDPSSTCLLSLNPDQKSAQHAVDAVMRNLFGAYVRGLARILGAPAAP